MPKGEGKEENEKRRVTDCIVKVREGNDCRKKEREKRREKTIKAKG